MKIIAHTAEVGLVNQLYVVIVEVKSNYNCAPRRKDIKMEDIYNNKEALEEDINNNGGQYIINETNEITISVGNTVYEYSDTFDDNEWLLTAEMNKDKYFNEYFRGY